MMNLKVLLKNRIKRINLKRSLEIGCSIMRHGRRSRPTLLNLGVRRLVGAEPEVDKFYTQTALERSNNCLLASKFDLSKAAFVVGCLSVGSAPTSRLTPRLSKIGRLRRPWHISFPNYDTSHCDFVVLLVLLFVNVDLWLV